jgi:hypothetical protein
MQITRLKIVVLAGVVSISSFGLAGTASAGRPANGSVGNADDKAPRGQSFGDHNKGYECDDNNGVGRGNPAHSADCGYDPYCEGDYVDTEACPVGEN